MAEDGSVVLDCRGRTAFVTFARPAARNAMTWRMYEQLREACARIRGDTGIRVVVLRGAGGKAFVAGTDIAQFTSFASPEDGLRYEEQMEDVVADLESLPQPTLAVVEGYAVGGGLMLAAVCDLRVCTPDARFGLPVARTLGNCLSMTNYRRLVYLLGPAATKSLTLRADFLTAADALACGLVGEVVERDGLDAAVAALCDTLAGHAPLTMWATKEAVRRLGLQACPDGDDIVRTVYASADFQEGVAAFLEKRAPRWTGR